MVKKEYQRKLKFSYIYTVYSHFIAPIFFLIYILTTYIKIVLFFIPVLTTGKILYLYAYSNIVTFIKKNTLI